MRGSSRRKSCASIAANAARQMARSHAGGGVWSLIGILALPYDEDRPPDDREVELERPVPQVIEVVFDARLHLVEGFGLAAQPVHLRPAGDARPHLVPHHVAL